MPAQSGSAGVAGRAGDARADRGGMAVRGPDQVGRVSLRLYLRLIELVNCWLIRMIALWRAGHSITSYSQFVWAGAPEIFSWPEGPGPISPTMKQA